VEWCHCDEVYGASSGEELRLIVQIYDARRMACLMRVYSITASIDPQ